EDLSERLMVELAGTLRGFDGDLYPIGADLAFNQNVNFARLLEPWNRFHGGLGNLRRLRCQRALDDRNQFLKVIRSLGHLVSSSMKQVNSLGRLSARLETKVA